MQEMTDAQLLREYAKNGIEEAFREIVLRYTDMVYCSALRQVGSSAAACDIAQSVFTDLATKARPLAEKLTEEALLAGWLHRSTRYAALNHLRDERRRQMRERQAMEHLNTSSETTPEWDSLGPVLDEALCDLNNEERDALLLRFFKNNDFRAIGQSLGVSEDAAQKRVSRAVEKLRIEFARRGVTTTAGALSAALAANAVTAAPAGLAATLSSTACASTAIALTKTIAMTLLQKTLITTLVTVALGTGIYQARQASNLSSKNRLLQQQQMELTQQIQQLQRERDTATNRVASLLEESDKKKSNLSEVLKLRNQVTKLKTEKNNNPANPLTEMAKSPQMKDFMRTIFATSFEKTYAPLLVNLHLSSDQTTALKELILDEKAVGSDMGLAMLSGNLDAAKQKEINERTKTERDSINEKIKQLLGDDNYTQYEAYEKNLSERMTIGQFKDQLAGSTLSADQEEQLIKMMGEERQNFKFSVDYSDKTKLAGDYASYFSEENLNKHQQEQEQLNKRYFERTKNILSPDQTAAFETFLSNQQQMQNTMMRASAKMFAPKAN